MGEVRNPDKAFKTCRGHKTSQGEVKLYSEGVKGELNEDQKRKCEVINVENTDQKYFDNIQEVKEEGETLDLQQERERILEEAVNSCMAENPEKPLQQQEDCVRRQYNQLKQERGIGEY